jgi:hypothetical protein
LIISISWLYLSLRGAGAISPFNNHKSLLCIAASIASLKVPAVIDETRQIARPDKKPLTNEVAKFKRELTVFYDDSSIKVVAVVGVRRSQLSGKKLL